MVAFGASDGFVLKGPRIRGLGVSCDGSKRYGWGRSSFGVLGLCISTLLSVRFFGARSPSLGMVGSSRELSLTVVAV